MLLTDFKLFLSKESLKMVIKNRVKFYILNTLALKKADAQTIKHKSLEFALAITNNFSRR
jgi:hypothetical protein